ncbi:adenylyltransferase/cytidyltransferase family protein [Escherichia coli]
MKTVITFGTFDVFHVGHLRLLQRARALGERLLVGVSSDALNIAKKGRAPVYHQDDRMAIIAGLACVDGVFWKSRWSKKRSLRGYSADILVMGMTGQGSLTALRIFVRWSISPARRRCRRRGLLR